MPYEPQKIEPKWQKKWEETELYKAVDFDSHKPKSFTLIEFPYPSGAGLHVGHARSWSAMDCYSRQKRMAGFNVLYPMGWDAFGLPAENYAIKMGKHPSKTVAENIQRFKTQCQSLGLSFDWSREINTTDPKYYKWTQWIFLKLLEKGLAYRAETPVNWCPACKTTLADEEVLADGRHERCGNQTEKRQQKQWILKITAYAQRLLDDLKSVDYSPRIAIQQENWIGRSEGLEEDWQVEGMGLKLKTFTTWPHTTWGATFMVIAPEHPIISELVKGTEYEVGASDFCKKAIREKIADPSNVEKKKEGFFIGRYVVNPLSKRRMPLYLANFAIYDYGTGIVKCTPTHDQRDFEFAKKYKLDFIPVIYPKGGKQLDPQKMEGAYTGEGIMMNAGSFDGMPTEKARKEIGDYSVKNGHGRWTISYHLRDWVFSRQHYWGEPIPIVYCDKCGIVPVPEKDLPVELPFVEKYEPSGTGESPLANIKDWVNTKCPKCGGAARRETDTMPNWAGSNWYYLAYLFADRLGNQNAKIKSQNVDISDETNIFEECKKQIEYWMPVDIYQGGFEHTTLHLLYSRFIYKFLYDIGVVPTPEPYAKRRSHGIVLASDNKKMSKSFGNVINPDDIAEKYGADTLRLYEMFMGPFDQAISWSEESLQGCFRFLNRVWQLFENNIKIEKTPDVLLRKLHQTIKKVSEDIEELKFNTMVASMMEFINDWQKEYLSKQDAELFIKILAVSAPHFAEEVWCEVLKNKFSVHQQEWPKYDKSLIIEEMAIVIVQVNGKVRGEIRMQNAKCKIQNDVEEMAKKDARVMKYLDGKEIKKVIFVSGKLINFVI